jgi:nitrile hydratase
MHGFGAVVREADEPVFHARWEGQVRAMMYAAMAQGIFNIDEMRHGIERMAPAEYLTSGYYERWLRALETLLVEKGVLRTEEIEARTRRCLERPDESPGRMENPALVARLDPARQKLGRSPNDRSARSRFKIGEWVRARNVQPPGHTRLPRYVRGKQGRIETLHGAAILPDASAHGAERREPLYGVRFSASELWGASAEPAESVNLELWESYLEPVDD